MEYMAILKDLFWRKNILANYYFGEINILYMLVHKYYNNIPKIYILKYHDDGKQTKRIHIV